MMSDMDSLEEQVKLVALAGQIPPEPDVLLIGYDHRHGQWHILATADSAHLARTLVSEGSEPGDYYYAVGYEGGDVVVARQLYPEQPEAVPPESFRWRHAR